MNDARTVLEAYAAKPLPDHVEVVSFGDTAATFAPEAIKALRAVLDLADHYDNLGDRMWTESAADDIRRAIATALEAS